jgi:agmatinase
VTESIDLAITAQTLNSDQAEPTYSGVQSFVRRRYTKDLEEADIAVFGIPLDLATTNRPGARFGPAAVRAASLTMAWERPYGWEFDPRKTLSIVDYGDLNFDFARPDRIPAEIERQVSAILKQNTATLALGGDHYVSYPILKAIHEHQGPVALVHFDAHSDTWADEDDRLYSHGTMFWHAAREGLVIPEKSVQIGIRTHNPETMGFNIFDAPWVHAHSVDALCAEVRRIVGNHPAYLTFDIDCLDPAFAPGTGTPVSGGLSSAQALAILRGLRGLDFVGADVVEVAPAYDVGQVTALAAAHIGYEFLALYAARPGGPNHLSEDPPENN